MNNKTIEQIAEETLANIFNPIPMEMDAKNDQYQFFFESNEEGLDLRKFTFQRNLRVTEYDHISKLFDEKYNMPICRYVRNDALCTLIVGVGKYVATFYYYQTIKSTRIVNKNAKIFAYNCYKKIVAGQN